MALDLYQRLGIQRGASEAEIKKAYRSLAKQLHPDRNRDKPDAAKRFGEITQAYDVLSDKDKRARYDRGELDEDGNPKMPFGGGGFGGGGGFNPGARSGGPGGGGAHPGAGFDNFSFNAGDGADLSDLFEGLFGAAAQGRAAPGGKFGGFRGRAQAAHKGGDIAYRLKVPFTDAVALKTQRIALADGKTIDLKLPKGVADGTKIRLAGKGQEGPAGRGDGIVALEIAGHRFFTRDKADVRLTLPISLKEAVLGAKVRVPTADGPVMLTIPKGTSSGKSFRLKGKGFTAKDGKRGDQLVTVAVDVPAGDENLQRFAESWDGGGNPRSGLGV
ncbi:MAG: J domain-containing protein [Sphingomicrobium sp.]